MVGKWNKSVILSYIGLMFSIAGIILVFNKVELRYIMICLMLSGVCDMFDGTVARMCKRSDEEKQFGIELDSLIDVISFAVFPIIILCSLKGNDIINYFICCLYGVCAVARLAHYNILSADANKAISYYEGLPVTTVAIIFPLDFLIAYLIDMSLINIIYPISMVIVSILFITKFKIKKPNIKLLFLMFAMAIIASIVYLVVL